MDWIELKKDSAQAAFDEYFINRKIDPAPQFAELRNDLCMLFDNALSDIGITSEEISQKNNSYQLDLLFGIKLYSTLNEKYGMNVRKFRLNLLLKLLQKKDLTALLISGVVHCYMLSV